MVELKIFLDRLIFLVSVCLAFESFAGNGSSGVGNAPIALSMNLEAINPDSSLIKNGPFVLDRNTLKPIVRIGKIKYSQLISPTEDGEFVRSQLGAVNGFEFLPFKENHQRLNYWVVCQKMNEGCISLIPLNNLDPRISELMGTLKFKD